MHPKRFACWSLFIYLLIVDLGSCDPMNIRMVTSPKGSGGGGSSGHMHNNHMDLNLVDTMFFHFENLKLGNSLQVYFPDGDPNPLRSPHILSKHEADAIPFSSHQIPYILQHFNILPGSKKAQVIESTLDQCESKPVKGETKTCVASLESMYEFVRKELGTLETNVRVFSTQQPATRSAPAPRLQNYTIVQEPRVIVAPKMISCHTFPYPYIVFYCHSQKGDNRVYRVSLLGETDGEKIEAIAACHLDTSGWNRDHVAFRVLGFEPGTHPVCHFFLAESFVLLPMI